RHGCRVRAYKDVLAACPAMVGGQGPCSQAADQLLYKLQAMCLECTDTAIDVQMASAKQPAPT
ncbi:hypothetical protein AE932_17185, partial [Xanthomonas arboricola]